MIDSELKEIVLHEVQRARIYFYDPIELRKNRLISLFKLEPQSDPGLAIRHAITDSIQAMKPDPKIPRESNAWRIYQVLSYRFIEQSSQKEVATGLALGIRQLRRLESQAVEALVDAMLARYPLAEYRSPVLPATSSSQPEIDKTEEQELEWLRTTIGKETIQVTELIETSLKTARLLAEKLKVLVDLSIPETLPLVLVQVTTFRQVLLNLLTAGTRLASGSRLHLEVQKNDQEVVIYIWVDGLQARSTVTAPEIDENINLARQLIVLSSGRLEISLTNEDWWAKIYLPLAEQFTVLVIDDNTDALRLVERYLTGSRYHFEGIRDPAQAIEFAEETQPHIILLDVMLPGLDGWELLGRLREHPKLGNVPVIISTILPQSSLANTLGAAGFLRKPFSQDLLLQALDQFLVRPVIE